MTSKMTDIEPVIAIDDAVKWTPPQPPVVKSKDWRTFAGQLKSSPTFEGDPVSIQQEMRNEWD